MFTCRPDHRHSECSPSCESNLMTASRQFPSMPSVHWTRITTNHMSQWAGQLSPYSDWLRAGRSGDRIPVGGEIFRTCPDRPWGPPSLLCNGSGSFPGAKSGRGVTQTHLFLLVPWSRKSRAIPLLPLRAVRPVQSLSACTRVHFYICHKFVNFNFSSLVFEQATMCNSPCFLPLCQLYIKSKVKTIPIQDWTVC